METKVFLPSNQPTNVNFAKICSYLIAIIAGLTFATPLAFADDPECSFAKTNHDCILSIDRTNPLAPPTIQMYPGARLTVVIAHPYSFERYFVDYTSGQLNLLPDVATNIASGLAPYLKGLSEMAELRAFSPAVSSVPADNCTVAKLSTDLPTASDKITPERDATYRSCLTEFAKKATEIYLNLEPFVAPDSHPQQPSPAAASGSPVEIAQKIVDLYAREAQLSAAISIAGALLTIDPTKPPSPTTPDASRQIMIRNWLAGAAIADAVAKDLSGFAFRIGDLAANPLGSQTPVNLFQIIDPASDSKSMVTRQLTYAVNALNLFQNGREAIPDSSKKRTLASVTVIYGETRWEASAGAFFSTLANRSFAVSPVLVNGVLTNTQITQKLLRPTVVPFAAANFRIGNDLSVFKWRSAFYWTFAIGANPNTVTADFGSGPSISWRGLMFSALWHAGQDVRLTQGLYVNQLLGPAYSNSVTTQNHWRFDRVALGISVRVPSLTGR